jgi:hypothetical protein
MFVKPFQKSYSLLQLEVLVKRLMASHEQFSEFQDIYKNRMAGYKGEFSTKYPLSFLPKEDYFIFHNLRLFDGSHYFQLDILVLSIHTAIIVEVKNMAGTLIFDIPSHQLIQINRDAKKAFQDPLVQVDRQTNQLEKFLLYHSLPKIPVESVVVISSPSTIIKINHEHPASFENKIIHAVRLPQTISSLEKKHNPQITTLNTIAAMSPIFLENHSELKQDILTKSNLPSKVIKKGVICPKCSAIPMSRKRGFWLCLSCKASYQDAHINALKDYVYLFDPYINNQKAREFLMLSSESATRNLLTSLNVPRIGERKGRLYKIGTLIDS